ncbi:hypothetical protein KB553_09045 [Chryseobacterium rhizoplanae]|uniref:hypothetical protein n=1 Tax=Chryseobacterium rhizoplanae TaxID=1609531 RepID=UPI001CE39C69|nr:hypothetical protein [Chryseobacterium rhizoplanae]UCA61667.1 hypothetical protein KB553_09045 [Chryseobacterium rhizoplanae]
MSNKKKFQEKANALFEKYPEANKIFISENGQCFFDEKAAKDYHDLRGFENQPEVFFREGTQDEDDSDLQEALHNSQLARKALEGIIEDIAAVCDLDQDYEPANADTDETVTSVISLREKYAEKDRLLTEMGTELEKLSNVATENENLKQQVEAANGQIEALNKTPTAKTKKDASQTDSTKA